MGILEVKSSGKQKGGRGRQLTIKENSKNVYVKAHDIETQVKDINKT